MPDNVKDVLQVENQFYVRATSALADDRTRVLKYGKTFAVFNRYGDVETLGPTQFGIFYAETRHLSRFTLRLNGDDPMLLSSTIRDDNGFLAVDLSNVDSEAGGKIALPRGTIHIFRSKFLDADGCHEQLRVQTYGLEPVKASIAVRFEADFADIFEVRGSVREQHGTHLPVRMGSDEVVLGYCGLAEVRRRTRLRFEPRPDLLTETLAQFDVILNPNQEIFLNITVQCEQGNESVPIISYPEAFAALRERVQT